jgi:hypothetical protein
MNASRQLAVFEVSYSHATDNRLVKRSMLRFSRKEPGLDEGSSGWPVNVSGAVDATQIMSAPPSLDLVT